MKDRTVGSKAAGEGKTSPQEGHLATQFLYEMKGKQVSRGQTAAGG